MLVKRDSFLRVGLFSTSLPCRIGVDWYARALDSASRARFPPILVLERRLYAETMASGSDSKPQYLHVLKAALDRRRAAGTSMATETSPPAES